MTTAAAYATSTNWSFTAQNTNKGEMQQLECTPLASNACPNCATTIRGSGQQRRSFVPGSSSLVHIRAAIMEVDVYMNSRETGTTCLGAFSLVIHTLTPNSGFSSPSVPAQIQHCSGIQPSRCAPEARRRLAGSLPIHLDSWT